jgi:hypothetical protein
MSATTTKHRPFGATLLAILAGIAAVLAAFHLLQSLGILPYVIGEYSVRGFNLWVAQMLWRVDPQAWLFLAVITVFNLVINFTYLIGKAEWSDVSLSFIVNAVILIYIMLPGVRQAFGQK